MRIHKLLTKIKVCAMSVIEEFCDKSNMRLAAIGLAAVFLSGCAMTERVVSHNVKRGSYDARSAVKDTVRDATRIVACPVGQAQPQQRDDSLMGRLGSIWDRETTVTTVPMTQEACREAQQRNASPGPRPRY